MAGVFNVARRALRVCFPKTQNVLFYSNRDVRIVEHSQSRLHLWIKNKGGAKVLEIA